MKKKILILAVTLVIAATAIVAFAYQRTASTTANAMACCCKGESASCPMKAKDSATGETTSCCDDPKCCCKGAESCPMMKKGEASKEAMDMNHTTAEGKTDCCSCACCKKDSQT
jgi:hypothetical protein